MDPKNTNSEKPARVSRRFARAVEYAARLHAGQMRKQTNRPYIAHLLGVASIVLEHGGDEEQAIAALLHDAVEDQGGLPRLREIRARFGRRVADIVEHCTDSFTEPKADWRERKEAYLARVPQAPAEARLVSLADKVYNVREILADYRVLGEALWSRFQGRRDGTLWYYRALVEAFGAAGSSRLLDEFDRLVTELERLAERAGAS